MVQKTENYDANSIKVLKGLEAVKKRPGMYIGNTDDGSGLHHMIYEVTDNAIDEALAGHCDRIIVTLNLDGSVTVIDNGRGMPIDEHKDEKISAVELIMTQLHTGGKFDNNSYKVSGGLHGVGISVVNALSEWLELIIWRNGKEYTIRFEYGRKIKDLESRAISDIAKTGTQVKFYPSDKIFSHIKFSFTILEHRYKELAFLNPNIAIELYDKRGLKKKFTNLHFKGGILNFVKYLDRAKNAINSTVIISEKLDQIGVDIAFQWNDSYHENILTFTNNIRQKDGGTHLTGFRVAVTKIINSYIEKNKFQKRERVKISSEDIREGLTSIISVKLSNPRFSSQTKEKLISSEVRSTVEFIVSKKFSRWLEMTPKEAKLIISRMIDSATAREAARKAKELSRKQSTGQILTLPGKLANCQERNPKNSELFLVEGDSAGGSAKQGRDRKSQAILPLKGKILNVERARLDKMLNFKEIVALVNTLEITLEDKEFDLTKLRYHKVIIMTDADVDGAHIRTLLLTFFFRYMPTLIEKGYLYIAQPPLYKVKKGQFDAYLKDDLALHNYLKNIVLKNTVIKYSNESLDNNDVKNILNKIIAFSNIINNFKNKIPSYIIEKLIFLGFFDRNLISNANFNNLANDLKQLFAGKLIEFKVIQNNETIRIYNIEEDIKTVYDVSQYLFSKKNKELLIDLKMKLSNFIQNGMFIYKNENIFKNCSISELVKKIFICSKKGLYIQRFKGLGEMNPEQLWQTTLNPDCRTLLQVKVSDTSNANDIFSTLMGDVVGPRKTFIKNNALKVSNLDY